MFRFPSGVHLHELVDGNEHPAEYITRYTVTGMTHKTRKRRTESIGKLVPSINGKQLMLWKVKGQVYATGNICPHQGAPLELGDVEDLGSNPLLTCPAHNWRFNLKTGRVNRDIVSCDKLLDTYPVEIDEHTSEIFVLFDSLDKSCFDLAE